MSLPIAILVSGRGSNMRALISAEKDGNLEGHIRCVISSSAQAPALDYARNLGIETHVCAHAQKRDQEILEILRSRHIGLICLAGYMHLLSDTITSPYEGLILNIHPSLLPCYPGLHTHQRVLEAGDTEHGCTVHFATDELDGGPRIIQARVPVLIDDDEDCLAARVLEQEHQIYPRAVRWFCQGELVMTESTAWLRGKPLAEPVPHALA